MEAVTNGVTPNKLQFRLMSLSVNHVSAMVQTEDSRKESNINIAIIELRNKQKLLQRSRNSLL